ncbi:uncharacterized protein PAC_08219 [Phialocephala subalpina]|uniref:Uncharacterized protein n=1 Tax=Phialocephala subalpina TaxID=576137 RepID=A0A1L7X000_9HELO|nr:uncharacterized protein PAC_08219 [Phialocephala subalpina]
MAEHVVINAAQGSFSPSTLSINLKVDSGCKIYGFLLDEKMNSQGKISSYYPKSNPAYATFADNAQQTLSINLRAIPEEVHFIKAYIEDKQEHFLHKPVGIQLSYRAQGMERIKTVSDICISAKSDHALTLEKKDSTWRFWFGDCEDYYKHK